MDGTSPITRRTASNIGIRLKISFAICAFLIFFERKEIVDDATDDIVIIQTTQINTFVTANNLLLESVSRVLIEKKNETVHTIALAHEASKITQIFP